MKLDARDIIQRTILLTDDWDPLCTRFIVNTLRPGMNFLDIGANAGYYTLLAAQLVSPGGRVLSVEPSTAMTEQADRDVRRSGFNNVTFAEAACAERNETRMLYLSEFPNPGKSSLSSENAGNGRCIPVRCVTADLLCQTNGMRSLDLVKIDVEGAEMQVLGGMVDLLSKMRPKIIVELRPDLLKAFSTSVETTINLIQGYGYRRLLVDDQSNYIFVPFEKRGSIS